MEQLWHVLHVSSNQEKKVALHLQSRSIDFYLPLYQQRRVWSDRTVLLEKPLFPGYVFVRLMPDSRIKIISTPGVLRLLGEDVRHTIGAAELQRIREALAGGYVMRPSSGLLVGTRVRILRGVFAGFVGMVSKLRTSSHVIIEISGVRQSISIQLNQTDLQVVSAASSTDMKSTAFTLSATRLSGPSV